MTVLLLLPFLFFLCLFTWDLKVWYILHHLLDIVHGVGNRLFFCCVHDLLHTLCKFLLQIDRIEFLCVGRYLRNLNCLGNNLS